MSNIQKYLKLQQSKNMQIWFKPIVGTVRNNLFRIFLQKDGPGKYARMNVQNMWNKQGELKNRGHWIVS